MKRLLLLRHGKAEGAAADDRERALIPRGATDSARMGRFLHDDAYIPDLVLCSTSVRTRQTLEQVLPALGASPRIEYLDELYLAEPEAILSRIRHAPETCAVLMVVGHNPGMEQIALALAAVPLEKKLRKRYGTMDEKFPTCALAVIDFEVPRWSGVLPGRGDLDAFVRPKDFEI